MIPSTVTRPSHPRELPGQNITLFEFKVLPLTVVDQALVYGPRTAKGIAGGLAGEYNGSVILVNCASVTEIEVRATRAARNRD